MNKAWKYEIYSVVTNTIGRRYFDLKIAFMKVKFVQSVNLTP